MFVRLSSQEAAPLLKGVVIVALFILLGIAATEYQLNSLTLRQQEVQAFNISHRYGVYSFHLLGYKINISAVYPIAMLDYNGQQIVVKIGDGSRNYAISTVLLINTSTIEYWLTRWGHQFVAEAYKTKQNLVDSMREVADYIIHLRQMLAGYKQ